MSWRWLCPEVVGGGSTLQPSGQRPLRRLAREMIAVSLCSFGRELQLLENHRTGPLLLSCQHFLAFGAPVGGVACAKAEMKSFTRNFVNFKDHEDTVELFFQ